MTVGKFKNAAALKSKSNLSLTNLLLNTYNQKVTPPTTKLY